MKSEGETLNASKSRGGAVAMAKKHNWNWCNILCIQSGTESTWLAPYDKIQLEDDLLVLGYQHMTPAIIANPFLVQDRCLQVEQQWKACARTLELSINATMQWKNKCALSSYFGIWGLYFNCFNCHYSHQQWQCPTRISPVRYLHLCSLL